MALVAVGDTCLPIQVRNDQQMSASPQVLSRAADRVIRDQSLVPYQLLAVSHRPALSTRHHAMIAGHASWGKVVRWPMRLVRGEPHEAVTRIQVTGSRLHVRF